MVAGLCLYHYRFVLRKCTDLGCSSYIYFSIGQMWGSDPEGFFFILTYRPQKQQALIAVCKSSILANCGNLGADFNHFMVGEKRC